MTVEALRKLLEPLKDYVTIQVRSPNRGDDYDIKWIELDNNHSDKPACAIIIPTDD